MMRDRIHLVVTLLAAAVMWVFGVIVWWEIQPATPPVDLSHINQEILDIAGNPRTEFKPGDTVYVRTTMTQVRSRGARMISQILFDEGRQLIAFQYAPVASVVNEPGTHTGSMRAMILPQNLPSGSYSRRVLVTYALNPLRPLETYTLPPVLFTVK